MDKILMPANSDEQRDLPILLSFSLKFPFEKFKGFSYYIQFLIISFGILCTINCFPGTFKYALKKTTGISGIPDI